MRREPGHHDVVAVVALVSRVAEFASEASFCPVAGGATTRASQKARNRLYQKIFPHLSARIHAQPHQSSQKHVRHYGSASLSVRRENMIQTAKGFTRWNAERDKQHFYNTQRLPIAELEAVMEQLLVQPPKHGTRPK